MLLTRGRPTVVYPESLLTFRLDSPVTVDLTHAPQAFRYVSPDDFQGGSQPTMARRAPMQGGPSYGPHGPGYGASYGPGYGPALMLIPAMLALIPMVGATRMAGVPASASAWWFAAEAGVGAAAAGGSHRAQ